MKSSFSIILAALISLAITYLLICFVSFDWNVRDWDWFIRLVAIVISALLLVPIHWVIEGDEPSVYAYDWHKVKHVKPQSSKYVFVVCEDSTFFTAWYSKEEDVFYHLEEPIMNSIVLKKPIEGVLFWSCSIRQLISHT